jgi:16S rRNA (adenine1518-N6/adenine1519-N6)-dimethyltransferase
MPNKRRVLGQHMLVDRKVLADIVDAAEIDKDEIACEVGTGQGILTVELCKRARKVLSFEIDKALYSDARSKITNPNLELTNADPFHSRNLRFDVFVSNLPYSRSRDAFEWLATQKFKRGVVMVQKEFADKLLSGPDDKNYRAISALAACCFRLKELFHVSSKSFEPQPRIESVVLGIQPIRVVSQKTIRNLNLLFSKRNRKASSVASKAGIADFESGETRIDKLSPRRILELAVLMSE